MLVLMLKQVQKQLVLLLWRPLAIRLTEGKDVFTCTRVVFIGCHRKSVLNILRICVTNDMLSDMIRIVLKVEKRQLVATHSLLWICK